MRIVKRSEITEKFRCVDRFLQSFSGKRNNPNCPKKKKFTIRFAMIGTRCKKTTTPSAFEVVEKSESIRKIDNDVDEQFYDFGMFSVVIFVGRCLRFDMRGKARLYKIFD